MEITKSFFEIKTFRFSKSHFDKRSNIAVSTFTIFNKQKIRMFKESCVLSILRKKIKENIKHFDLVKVL